MTVKLESLRGRIGDVDAHEFIPVHRFPEIFGEIGQRFIENGKCIFDGLAFMPEGHPHRLTEKVWDDAKITEQSVWENKGIYAPGHADMDRRVAVMDQMGVGRELVFPGFGLLGLIQASGGGQATFPVATAQEIAVGREVMSEHNKWAGSVTRKHPNRLSIVGMVSTGDPGLTPEMLAKRTEEVIDTGVKAIQISSGEPPAGLSPADAKLDPFYAAFAQANVALVFHPPSWMGYRKSEVWEAALHPSQFVTPVYQPMENFLAVMLMGGVFDRHPNLRVGFIETGSSWIGPLCERIERGATGKIDLSKLKLKPSEYLVRNVRVSALLDEPIEYWIERYPALQDVYCWSSDYPHVEGGQWSLNEAYKRVAPLGDTLVEKYFVKNSELLFN